MTRKLTHGFQPMRYCMPCQPLRRLSNQSGSCLPGSNSVPAEVPAGGCKNADSETPSALLSRMAAWGSSTRPQGCLPHTSIHVQKTPQCIWRKSCYVPIVDCRQGAVQSAIRSAQSPHWAASGIREPVWHLERSYTFSDLTKAFDTISWDGLRRSKVKYGCPRNCIAIIHQFHDGMLARVQNNGKTPSLMKWNRAECLSPPCSLSCVRNIVRHFQIFWCRHQH